MQKSGRGTPKGWHRGRGGNVVARPAVLPKFGPLTTSGERRRAEGVGHRPEASEVDTKPVRERGVGLGRYRVRVRVPGLRPPVSPVPAPGSCPPSMSPREGGVTPTEPTRLTPTPCGRSPRLRPVSRGRTVPDPGFSPRGTGVRSSTPVRRLALSGFLSEDSPARTPDTHCKSRTDGEPPPALGQALRLDQGLAGGRRPEPRDMGPADTHRHCEAHGQGPRGPSP